MPFRRSHQHGHSESRFDTVSSLRATLFSYTPIDFEKAFEVFFKDNIVNQMIQVAYFKTNKGNCGLAVRCTTCSSMCSAEWNSKDTCNEKYKIIQMLGTFCGLRVPLITEMKAKW